MRIGDLLAQTYNGRIAAFYPYFPEGPLVRVQFIVGRYEGETPHVEIGELERRIEAIVLTWEDRLADVIAGTGDRSEALLAKYGSAFSAGYAETFPPERALEDIERIERLGPDQPLVIDFHRDPGAPAGRIHAAVYSLGASDPPLRARAGAGEPRASRPSTSAPTRSARALPTGSARWRCTT